MTKVGLLVLNYFRVYLGSFRKSRNKRKYVSGALFVLIFGVMFVFLFSSMAMTTMQTALKIGEPELALYVTSAMLFMFLLFMTISRSTATRKSNDDELLLALPINKRHIVTAKILYNYLFDLIFNMVSLVPAVIIYYIYVGPGIDYLIRSGIILLLLPMLSNAVGALLGLLFKKLASKYRSYYRIQSFISIIFMILFLVGYYAIQIYINNIANNPDSFSLEDIIVLKVMVDFMLGGANWWLYGLIIGTICIIPFIVCIILNARHLGKTTGGYHSKKTTLEFKVHSIENTLLRHELNRYLNISTYVVNTLFGGVILILLSIAYLVIGPDYILNKMGTFSSMIGDYVNIIVIVICTTVLSTVCISASSISIEGKNLWILRAQPISYKKIFKSKILANFIIVLGCIAISTLFIGIRFILSDGWVGALYIIGLVIITSLYALIISIIGLLVNLNYPKLVWESEVEVVKQGISVGITLAINVAMSIMTFVPYLLLAKILDPLYYLPIAIGIELVILVIILLVLNKKGQKLFEKIQ